MGNRDKTFGTGVGRGHGGNTANLPVIREVANSPHVQLFVQLGQMEQGVRTFRMGKAVIFLAPPQGEQGWHLSIARPDRYPSWDEVAKAWYELVPDSNNRAGVMFLPPRAEFVNVHNYCFHIYELLKG